MSALDHAIALVEFPPYHLNPFHVVAGEKPPLVTKKLRAALTSLLNSQGFTAYDHDFEASVVSALHRKGLVCYFNHIGDKGYMTGGNTQKITLTPLGCWFLFCPYVHGTRGTIIRALDALQAQVREYWHRCCMEDGITEEDAKFAVFSDDNRHLYVYNGLMSAFLAVRRILR